MKRLLTAGLLVAVSACVLAGSPSKQQARGATAIHFETFAHTGLKLSGVLWTGSRFVYTVEGGRTLYAEDSSAAHLRVFATVPRNNGEMRCILSPGSNGFPAHTLYCHAAQGPIYRMNDDGSDVKEVATIPTAKSGSDGSLGFDAVGAFGHTLIAATGGSDAGPGAVYSVTATGDVALIGKYTGPGGAENLLVAPKGFGSAAGQVLLAIDKHDHQGRLLAMDVHGKVRTLVTGLTWGLNTMTAIPATLSAAGTSPAAAGYYLADWLSHDVFFASAGALKTLSGTMIVTTERHNLMYSLRPMGSSYALTPLSTDLRLKDSNYEGAVFVDG